MRRSDLRQARIDADFDIPRTTAQQRRFAAGRNYAGPLLRKAKAAWKALAKANAPERPLEGALGLEISLFYKSSVEKPQYKTTRPDWDNAAKIVQDALAAAGWFADDARVAVGHVLKVNWPWHDHVVIVANELGELDDEGNT